MTLMSDMNVYVVGKGPSLNSITKEDFPNHTSPVMCINDAIIKIETLNLPNPMYVVQQDRYFRRNECVPKKGLLFISCYSQHRIIDGALVAVYSPAVYGVKKGEPTVVMAIKLAKYFGAVRFTFLCFDSCMSGDLTRAKCCLNYIEGWESEGYNTHKQRIIKAVETSPYKFQETKYQETKKQGES